MDRESTTNLLRILKDAGKSDIGGLDDEYFDGSSRGFSAYLDSIIGRQKLKRKDIFQKADLPQKYGYKLLSGDTRTTDRDKLLRIFIAIGMNLKETQRALSLYGMAALYPKKKRDAIFIIAINNGVTSVDTVNEWLLEYGENELSRSGN